MDIYQKKKALRKQIKETKQLYSLEEKKRLSQGILYNLEELPEFQSAKCILAYWSMQDEVHTHDFILKWSPIKKVLLPVVKADELELKEFMGLKDLVAGENFGIPEPNGEIFNDYEQIDLVIVPGVAFDHQMNRMGRGKAYYDQLLKNLKAFKIGLCFSFQYLKEVPHDELDIKMDYIIH